MLISHTQKMSVKYISHHLKSMLQSSCQIHNYATCISELINNSLDAESTSIAVRVNLLAHKIQVIDNGSGISGKEFKKIGKRYMTSKNTGVNKYGYKGEALASIIKVSKKVKIISKFDGKAWEANFTEGNFSDLKKVADRPSKGTTIEIRGFLYNLPVQIKSLNQSKELRQLKTAIQLKAVVHNGVSFTLRDDTTFTLLLEIHKSTGTLQRIKEIFGDDVGGSLQELHVEKPPNKLVGFIGERNDAVKLDLIYLNNVLITNSKMNRVFEKIMNKVFPKERKRFAKMRWNFDTDTVTASKDLNYVMLLFCPPHTFDLVQDSCFSALEFESWHPIEKLLEKFCNFYKDSINGTTKDVAVEIEKPEMVKAKVTDMVNKILKSDKAKIGYTQVQNHVRGRSIKRRSKIKSPIIKKTINKKPINSKLEIVMINLSKGERLKEIEGEVANRIKANTDAKTKSIDDAVVNNINKNNELDDNNNLHTTIGNEGFKKPYPVPKIKNVTMKRKNFDEAFKNLDNSIKRRCNEITNNVHQAVMKYKKAYAPKNERKISMLLRTEKCTEKSLIKKTGTFFIREFIPYNDLPKENRRFVLNKRIQPPRFKTGYDLLETIIPSAKHKQYGIIGANVNSHNTITQKLTYESHACTYKHKMNKYSSRKANEFRKDVQTQKKNIQEKPVRQYDDVLRKAQQDKPRGNCSVNFTMTLEYQNSSHTHVPGNIKSGVSKPTSSFDSLQVFDFTRNVVPNAPMINTIDIKSNALEFIRDNLNHKKDAIHSSQIHRLLSESILNVQSFTASNEKSNKNFEFCRPIYPSPSQKIPGDVNESDFAFMRLKNKSNYNNTENIEIPSTYILDAQIAEISRDIHEIEEKSKETGETFKQHDSASNFLYSKTINDSTQIEISTTQDVTEAASQLSNVIVRLTESPQQLNSNTNNTINTSLDNDVIENSFKCNNKLLLDPKSLLQQCVNSEEISTYHKSIGIEKNNSHSHESPDMNNIDIVMNDTTKEFTLKELLDPSEVCEVMMDKEKSLELAEKCYFDTINYSNFKDSFDEFEHNKRNISEDVSFHFEKNKPGFVPQGYSQLFTNKMIPMKKRQVQQIDNVEYFNEKTYKNFRENIENGNEIYGGNLQIDCRAKNNPKFAENARKAIGDITFAKEDLKGAQVINQIDRKFIAAIMRSSSRAKEYLVIFDQHAVHERIRWEMLLKEYKPSNWVSTECEMFSLRFRYDEMKFLYENQEKLMQLGLYFSLDFGTNSIDVLKIPTCILGRRVKKPEDIKSLVKKLIIETLETLKETSDVLNMKPKLLIDLVSMEACRNAIKFGDSLTIDKCKQLITELSNCQSAFQCAHGRPSISALASLANKKREYTFDPDKLKKWKKRSACN